MLITDTASGKLRVSGCYQGEMIDMGWISTKELKGWTLTKYEGWNEYCR